MGNVQDKAISAIVDYYKDEEMLTYELKGLKGQVENFFLNWPGFVYNNESVIHSIKTRIKDPEHLRDKLYRKLEEGKNINKENFRFEITDLVGIRILYLYQDQFKIIHNQIMQQIEKNREWTLVEPPKAYSWDPESAQLFDDLGIEHDIKDTYYTSVHYVIKPCNNEHSICCEIQVRTLFEEIWGEIDHTINYPHPTESIACREQLKVLAKLISTGTRLSDSIFRSHNEYSVWEND